MINFITEDCAFGILGGERFFSARRIISAWNKIIEQRRTNTNHNIKTLKRPTDNFKLKFTEDIIRQTIEEDKSWYMVYDLGFSLRNIKAILGSSYKNQPRQYEGNNWWLFQKDSWAEKEEEPNYYFVKLKTILSGKSWKAQEEILKNNKLFCRVPSRLIISIQISYFLLHGSYIAGHSYHWGPELDLDGKVRCISNVGPNGFLLYNWQCDSEDKEVGVFITQTKI